MVEVRWICEGEDAMAMANEKRTRKSHGPDQSLLRGFAPGQIRWKRNVGPLPSQ